MARERSESDWADEHPEYDIESEVLPSHVGEMAQPIYMWDVDATREQLEAEAPHRIYVVDTYSRVQRLVNILRSLSTIEKLFSFETFPVDAPGGKIHREAWLRVAIDAYLARITAIRDCLFLLTATVFELDLADRDVNFKSLKSKIGQPGLIDLLQKIAATGRDTRNERDLKFHRGIEREFDEVGLYRSISIIASVDTSKAAIDRQFKTGHFRPGDRDQWSSTSWPPPGASRSAPWCASSGAHT